jgi:hypothetical protein
MRASLAAILALLAACSITNASGAEQRNGLTQNPATEFLHNLAQVAEHGDLRDLNYLGAVFQTRFVRLRDSPRHYPAVPIVPGRNTWTELVINPQNSAASDEPKPIAVLALDGLDEALCIKPSDMRAAFSPRYIYLENPFAFTPQYAYRVVAPTGYEMSILVLGAWGNDAGKCAPNLQLVQDKPKAPH